VADRVLTAAELNRTLLARQQLLERSTAPLPTVLERMGGLQAQYAPAMYIGLWSRTEGLERTTPTRLLEAREIVQATLLRATIHVVSRADYWPWVRAVREERRRWVLRAVRNDPSAAELDAAAGKLRSALADGPLRQTEIDKLLSPAIRRNIGLWVDLVRMPPSGTWERRRADLYGLAEDWVGPEPDGTAEEAVELLVRRRLGGFGPATPAEIASWAGLPVAALTPVLAGMTLRRFRAEDGAKLVDLPDAPLPAGDTPAPVRFLANWDAALLVHARRTGLLPEDHRPRIFSTKTPHSFATFLVDGQVAGTWRHDAKTGRVTLDEFHPQPASVRRQLAAEADRIADFHA
jgi:hypothetical protein